MRATLIGFYGGACSRKSTLAAAVFVELKRRGLRAELATEPVKDYVLDGRLEMLRDQLGLLSDGLRKVERLRNACDFIVSDGPPFLGAAYCDPLDIRLSELYAEKARPEWQDHQFLVRREGGWESQGRVGDVEFAKRVDARIEGLLMHHSIPFSVCGPTDEKAIADLVAYAHERRLANAQ
jgi:AAA domain-containing protein